MACCVLLAGVIALLLLIKARLFGQSKTGHIEALRWRLKREVAEDV
jgi:hypothetical protein